VEDLNVGVCIMRTLALCLLVACSKPSPAPQTAGNTEASTPTPAAAAAEPSELATIRTADRAKIHWFAANADAERTGAELETLLDALVVSEQMPSGGENYAQITFYKGTQELGVVWSFYDGEWGITKTLGVSPALAQLLRR
jgi:hypothetical protein